jgi:hypothetical protein
MFWKRRAFRRLAKEEAARVKPLAEEAAAAIGMRMQEIEVELRRFSEQLCPRWGLRGRGLGATGLIRLSNSI